MPNTSQTYRRYSKGFSLFWYYACMKISFVSHGYQLAGNLFHSQKPHKLAFLLIQGWTGHQNIRAAQALAKLGFTCLTYDMRGNRESEGDIAEFSRADFVQDAVVAYDYLKKQVGLDTAIGVIGSSFGSYTAVLLAERRDVCCLSLRVPANYPDEGFDKSHVAQKNNSNDFKDWRARQLHYTENQVLQALHNFKGKVQIIEAGADEIVNRQVPKNYASAMANKAKLAYHVMQNAPHSLVNNQLRAEYEKLLTAWVLTNDGLDF